MSQDAPASRDAPAKTGNQSPAPDSSPLTEAERRSWFVDKEFAYDWASGQFPIWIRFFAHLRDHPLKMLEIGSYEGRSAIFFLNYLRQSSLTCVDPWDSSVLEPDLVKLMPEILIEYPQAEARFDRNLAEFSGRLTKIKARSSDALAELGVSAERFDLIYVDGEHRRAAAYRDCVLSWALLKPGGLLLIDDYGFGEGLAEEIRPRLGIDAFFKDMAGQFDELHKEYQILARKREPR